MLALRMELIKSTPLLTTAWKISLTRQPSSSAEAFVVSQTLFPLSQACTLESSGGTKTGSSSFTTKVTQTSFKRIPANYQLPTTNYQLPRPPYHQVQKPAEARDQVWRQMWHLEQCLLEHNLVQIIPEAKITSVVVAKKDDVALADNEGSNETHLLSWSG